MRLRRIATVTGVAAAAAATVFATTAALFPAAPRGPVQQPLPALTSQALAARYATDSAAITKAAASAKRIGDPALARALDALRGSHFLSFDHRDPGGDSRARLRHVPGDVRFPWHRLASGRGRGPGRAGPPARSGGPSRGHRLAWLQHSRHPQHGRPHVRRRRAGRERAAAVRDRSRPARRPRRPAVPQLRDGRLRPGRAAPARDRHRGVRQPRDGRLLGAAAAHQRPGLGGPGRRRLDPLHAPRPAARARLRPGSHRRRVRRPPVRLRRGRAQRLLPPGRHSAAQPGAHRPGRPGRSHPMTRPATGLRGLATRIDAATPPHRDRTVDALRALAIAGVILGHWLVTALVLSHGRAGDALHDASPLASLPALIPLSWIFQTLAIFFLVGGYATARSYTGHYRAWLRTRLARLSRPVAVLAAVWVPLAVGLRLGGVPRATEDTVLRLVLDPLWFLGVYAGLTALTPIAVAMVRRLGACAACVPAAVVAGVDLVRFGFGGPAWLGWINVMAGWLVPYLLGVAWARGAFRGWRAPALMLAGGAAATAALVAWAGYPASMVGVNGAAISNLNPPTLAAVTFGIAQAGLALLLRGPLARWMRRPPAWAAVATANLSAMTLYLWHQTAFLAVTAAGLAAGRPPGLLAAPVSALWVGQRLAWLPAFAAALAAAWLVFHRAERRPVPPARGTVGRWLAVGAVRRAVGRSDERRRRQHAA